MSSVNFIKKNDGLRCPFCGGNYVLKWHGFRCLMCDRTPNLAYEIYVIMEKNKPHKNWHVYSGRRRKSDGS